MAKGPNRPNLLRALIAITALHGIRASVLSQRASPRTGLRRSASLSGGRCKSRRRASSSSGYAAAAPEASFAACLRITSSRGSPLKNSADEASVGRRFTPAMSFTGAVAVFERAVIACCLERTPFRCGQVLGQFAALKAEIGLAKRYRIEDRRVGREMRLNHAVPSDQRRPCPRLSPNEVDPGRRSPASGGQSGNPTGPVRRPATLRGQSPSLVQGHSMRFPPP